MAETPFTLTPAQKVIASDLHRFRVLCCGRRFGKTVLAIDQMKACACIPGNRIVYIAPTFQQARDIAWTQLKRECESSSKAINEARLEITFVNGSLIALRGFEAVETLRGQYFNLVVIDEVASMRDFTHQWQEVIRPTLTDKKGEVIFISTPKGFNHFYDLYNMREKDSDYASFHFTSYDNPNVPADEITKARNSMTFDQFSQEYLADFTKTEGLVYKEFNRQVHLFTEHTEQYVETLLGVDFGYTNPAAVITIKRDRADGLWITNEWYERGKTDAQVAEYVAGLKANRVFPDPESPGAIKELKGRGVNVRDVVKGKDSIKNGINKVREFFKANKLHVHTSCINVISELEQYSYPDKQGGQTEYENPIKEYDHSLDAIRYCVTMAGKSQIETGVHDPGYSNLRAQYSAHIGRKSTPKRYGSTFDKKAMLQSINNGQSI